MQRDHVIDIAKGLGEILVCIHHSKFSTKFVINLIAQFHMPLFFILSGMMINIEKYSISKFIIKKIETLLFSYYTMSIFSFFNSINNNKNFNYKKYFFQTLVGKQEDNSYWFILSLFISQCLIFIILKIIILISKNKKILKNLFVLILLVISNHYGYYYAKYKNVYFKLNLVLLIISYITAGYFINLNRVFFDKYIFNIFFSPIYYYYYFKYINKNTYISFYSSLVGKPYYSNLLSFLGSFFILSLSTFIKSNWILEYFGKNSIYVYFLDVENRYYFDNLTNFFNKFIPKNIKPFYKNIILLLFNIILVISKILIYIQIFKFYFPWFFNFSYFYRFNYKKLLKKYYIRTIKINKIIN